MPLSPPPRDAAGVVVPHDHPEIAADNRIIRRISEEQCVADATGVMRVSTMAFQASTTGNKGMSVNLEVSIIEANLDAKAFVTQPPFVGSVWFFAGWLRSQQFQVGYDPFMDNLHHGEVWGAFSRARQKLLLRASQWFVQVDGVSLPR